MLSQRPSKRRFFCMMVLVCVGELDIYKIGLYGCLCGSLVWRKKVYIKVFVDSDCGCGCGAAVELVPIDYA